MRKLAALFYIAQDACRLRVTLEELGHPQPPTTIQIDNQCAKGIANGTVKQRRYKPMNMRFSWIRDWIKKATVYCPLEPGTTKNPINTYHKQHGKNKKKS
jgi:hypothetical protein